MKKALLVVVLSLNSPLGDMIMAKRVAQEGVLGYQGAGVIGNAADQDILTPEQLQGDLLKKYQGTINGIEKFSRTVGPLIEFDALAGASAIRQRIDEAANQLRGMGSVNQEAVESKIETTIHQILTTIFKKTRGWHS